MAEYPTYSTGTVSISNGDTSVVGSGTGWTDTDARAGDLIQIGTAQPVEIRDRTDATHLTLWAAWSGGAVSGGSYKVIKKSPSRFNATATMIEVSETFRAMNTDGYYFFVDDDETVPNPSYGNDGQYALQASTGKLWYKTGGAWAFVGVYKGFGLPAPWSSLQFYNLFDVASIGGSTYVCILAHINQTPPNATYWTLLASIGTAATITVGSVATGAGGDNAAVWNTGTSSAAVLNFSVPQGKSYAATSTTSLAIGTGSKAFTTQAGLAYTNGARVRATSAANAANWMEGTATYSGTTLTITVNKTNGSGTLADWNFNLAGEPGAGDLSSANNLSDVASASTSRTNLGLGTAAVRADTNFVRTDAAQTLSAAQKLQARSNAAVPILGYIHGLQMSAPGGTNALTIGIGAASDSSGSHLIILTPSMTKTSDGWVAGSGGGYDYGGTSADGWYHWYVIFNPTSGAVDAIFSANPTTPGLPSGFTHYRRIGSAKLPDGANWTGFTQRGDEFLLDVPVLDLSATAAGTTGTLVALTVPSGIKVDALYTGFAQFNSPGLYLKYSSPDVSNQAASGSNFDFVVTASGSDTNKTSQLRTRTNTSRQIRMRSDGAGLVTLIITNGWIDTRGRLGSS